MDKDLLKIKIADCFHGRGCVIEFDPSDNYGWLNINCGCCIFPDDIKRLRDLLYVSNISASMDYSSPLSMPYIEIFCCYKDVKL